MPRLPKVVVYAVNASAEHSLMLLRSVQSIRRCSDVAITVFRFGPMHPTIVEMLEKMGVVLHERPARAEINPTFLKWLALCEVNATVALFADTDTFFFRAPELLIEGLGGASFAARLEVGCQSAEPEWCGGMQVMPQFSFEKMHTLATSLGGRQVPVFNTGVMLLRQGLLGQLRRTLCKKIESINTSFESDWSVYPSTNSHIADEVAASLAFGTWPGFSWTPMNDVSAPFYLELRSTLKATAAVVHTWSHYYPDFLDDYISKESGALHRMLARTMRESTVTSVRIKAMRAALAALGAPQLP